MALWEGLVWRSTERERDRKASVESLILMVVKEGDRQALVKLIRDQKLNVDVAINDQGENMLHMACRLGQLDFVRTLVEIYDCNLGLTDGQGNTPLRVACLHQQLKVLSYLFHIIPQSTIGLKELLLVAVPTGSVDIWRLIFYNFIVGQDYSLKLTMHENRIFLHYLLSLVPQSHHFNQAMDTALHYACYLGHLPVIKFVFSIEAIFDVLLQQVPALIKIACRHWKYDVIDYFDMLLCSNPQPMLSLNKILDTIVLSEQVLKFMTRVPASNNFDSEPALFFAARTADFELYDHLMSLDSQISSRLTVNDNGETLLHAACASGDLDMVKRIYQFCTDIEKPDKFGNTCLHIATKWGSLNIIKYLLEKDCKLWVQNADGECALHLAIIFEHQVIFDFFLELDGIDINTANVYGETPLHLATSSVEVIEYAKKILAHPKFSGLDSPDNFGSTPLFNAVSIGSIEMILLLIDNNCNLLVCNAMEETVFHIACRLKMEDVLDLLFEKVTMYPSKSKNAFHQTLLQIACTLNDLEMVKYLIHQDHYLIQDDINVLDDSLDLTPLQYACVRNKASLFKCLIELGSCDPDTKNKKGYTALHICCKQNLEVAELCIKHCSFTVRNSDGDTPLHLACEYGNHKLALNLMNSNKIPCLDEYLNSSGHSVLHVAAKQKGAGEVLKCMVDKKICSHTVKTEQHGETALHIACNEGIIENAQYLFTLPYPDDCQYDKRNLSPLYFAYFNHRYDFFKSIVENLPSWQLQKCATSRFSLKFHPHEFVAEFPLLHCLLTSLANCQGDSCSLGSCPQIRDICSRILVLYPSVISMLDSHGCTVLHYLAFYSCKTMETVVDDVINLCNGKIDQMDKSQRSPMHLACLKHNGFMVYKLLCQDGGPEVLHQRDDHKKTPSDLYGTLSNPESLPPTLIYLAAHGADINIDVSKIEQSKLKSIPSINIIVAGNSSNGKTTLVQSLKARLGSQELKPVSTPTTGIVTDEVNSDRICYKFFDFAGQIEFEASHSVRLESLFSLAVETPSSPFIFLIVIKGKDSCDVNKKQIDKWVYFLCNHLKSGNKSIKAAFVCSHDDCFFGTQRSEREDVIEEYLQEKRRTSAFNVEFRPRPFFLDCRKTDTTSLNALLRYFDDVSFSCKLIPPNFACVELKTYLETWFNIPCQVKDLIQKIKDRRQFKFTNTIEVSGDDCKSIIPHEVNKLVDLLTKLHLQNDIILLMPPSSEKLCWWIINKTVQNEWFSKLSCIFSPSGFEDAPDLSSTHNTGVIPSSKLSDIFRNISFDMDLIENYLVCMGYCQVIEDREVLNLIVGNKRSDDEKHFFFPGLINKDKNDFSFPKCNSEDAYHSGWLLKSQQDLSLRFLHNLLLRLTFKFSCDKSSSKYSKMLSLWKCGMFWCTPSGINVLVEVQHDRRVFSLFRCSSDSDSKVHLAKLRSEVIGEIRDVLSKSIKEDNLSEYFLHPSPTDFCNYDTNSSFHHHLADLRKAFKKEPHCRSLFISDTETVKLSSILGFDAYVHIKSSVLSLLSKGESTHIVLRECFDTLQSKFNKDELELILDVSISDNICKKWMSKHGSKSLDKLRSQLDGYSVFKLIDLHT